MEEHSFLDGREGIKIFDAARAGQFCFHGGEVDVPGRQLEGACRWKRIDRGVLTGGLLLGGAREHGDRGMSEKLRRAESQARHARPSNQLNSQDRIDSQLEEVFFNADLVSSQ